MSGLAFSVESSLEEQSLYYSSLQKTIFRYISAVKKIALLRITLYGMTFDGESVTFSVRRLLIEAERKLITRVMNRRFVVILNVRPLKIIDLGMSITHCDRTRVVRAVFVCVVLRDTFDSALLD